MSASESFAARWSRLKRTTIKNQEAASAEVAPQSADVAPATASSPGAQAVAPQSGEPQKAPVDPESLPPIESLTAESDIRAFLQAGVPKELTRAALRRVWTTDPAIRDFIGLAENQWDFTDPTAMPGFGPLEATDDVRLLVSQAMGRLGELIELPDPARAALVSDAPAASDPEKAAGIEKENIDRPQGNNTEKVQLEAAIAEGQHVDLTERSPEIPKRRSHGGALPK
jgi:Protein of unknown function (DUF3306)